MLKIIFLFLLGSQLAYGQLKPDSVWMNQKFSMFIHWGLYSQLGGVWNGKPVVSGYSEQIQSHGGIFSDWYAGVARDFNPVDWDADAIVELAKNAGMKSIVFTSKHHDGFCMYHSRLTDYNIVDATPYKRDVMQELSEACQRQGMRFGVYFSLIDWHFPQAYPISSHNADPLTPEHYEYNLRQVEEIMTGYGPISEIWFDMGSLTPEQSRGLYVLVSRLQPQCMISGRLGNDCSDFSVMADNEYPDYKMGVPWQTAASFFDETWGYRSWQERGEVADKMNEKIKSLIKVVSRGGNYLLNIGPKGDGSIVPFEAQVLAGMGKWLGKYGEAIYGADANPFDYCPDWGDVTMKGNKLYLLVGKENRPERIALEGLRGKVKRAAYLGGESLNVAEEKGTWMVYPAVRSAIDSPVDVICVELEEGFEILPLHALVTGRTLTWENAVPVNAYSSMDYYTGFRSVIAYNWMIKSSAGQLKPVLFYTEEERGKKIVLTVDEKEREVVLDGGTEVKMHSPVVRWGSIFRKRTGGLLGSIPEVTAVDGVPEGGGGQLCEDL
ncbi:MAG: alpha-L-fucosidase, partial [Odoribacter sp.]|nr:alpha-L-fucosidase [Odoribacter sp.]